MNTIRKYLIIPSSLVPEINFEEVLNTSIDTLSYSADGTLTYLKYNVVIDEHGAIISGRPAIYSDQYQELNHDEVLIFLASDTWIYVQLPPSGSI